MVRKAFWGLLAMAVVAIVTVLFASSADAKERRFFIGGVLHTTTGSDGQPVDSTSWVEKGQRVTLTWATPARKAVVEKKVRLPKAKSSVSKNIQKKTAQQVKQPTSKLTPPASSVKVAPTDQVQAPIERQTAASSARTESVEPLVKTKAPGVPKTEKAVKTSRPMLIESSETDFPDANGDGHWTVSRKKYVWHEKNIDGVPVVRERNVEKVAWTNLPPRGEIRKVFAWFPGQILPPDWTRRVGDQMDGIDPATGNIMKFPIPNGAVTYCDNRGNAAGVIGKYTEVPEGAQLLAEITPKEKVT